jgi:GLPGLI family protein
MKNFLFSLFILCSSLNILAQKVSGFEGIIKYSVSFEDAGLPPEAIALFKNAEVKLYISPDKQRTDINMVMQNSTSIVDLKEKTLVNIMDIGGKKYLIKIDQDQLKKDKEAEPNLKINYTTETKNIAGYVCQKAEVVMDDALGTIMSVYFTEEIPLNEINPVYKGLKGFPLEYTMNMGGITIKFIANSITKEKIDKSVFDVSKEGYIETTTEALQQELMKQMIGE